MHAVLSQAYIYLYFFFYLFAVLSTEINGSPENHFLKEIQLYNRVCEFVVIAHRGASYYAPENTMAAFQMAYEMGADMIELDVQLTKDHIPVVIHDADLTKTTSGRGTVSAFTYEELKKLDAGSWFAPRFSEEKLPSLDEVLQWASHKIAVNIEIKTEAVALNAGVEEKVIDLVRQYNMEDYVLFSSFDRRAITNINQLAPEMKTGILYDKNQSRFLPPSSLVTKLKADLFHVNWRRLNNRWLKDLKTHNIPVFTYTVNKERRMRQLIRRGVKGIFSDKPDVLKRAADSEFENRCTAQY